MSIGENIRRLREREGLSQTAFAGRLDVTKETVGRWESGRTFPRRTHLDKMIADFAVCADDIMSEGPDRRQLAGPGDAKRRHGCR